MNKEMTVRVYDVDGETPFQIALTNDHTASVRSVMIPFLPFTVPYIKGPRLMDVPSQQIVIPFTERTANVAKEGNVFEVGDFGTVVLGAHEVIMYTRKQQEYWVDIPHEGDQAALLSGMAYLLTALSATGG